MSVRIAIVVLLSLGGCAAPTAKAPWPTAPVSNDATPNRASVAQGGPLERGATTIAPTVKIEYAPIVTGAGPRVTRPGRLMLSWPLPATGVTSLYGRRIDPLDGQTRFHRGLDMEAEYGTVVRASAKGQVVAAGWNGGYGRQVVIEHPGGFQTVYAHLAQILVPLGTYVDDAQPIGLVGTSGRTTGAHLHFEVTQWNRHLDPLDVLGVEMDVR